MAAQPVTLIPALPPPSTSGSSRQANQQLIFDFTKRKKWADLLVTELTEAIMLVLSDTGVIWYCGPAVEELLGWADEELVDGNFSEIMNEEDKTIFERQFQDAIQNRTDLLCYTRLRCKSEQDLFGPNIPVTPTVPSSSNAEGTSGRSARHSRKEVLFEIKGYAHYVMSSSLSQSTRGSGFHISDLRTMPMNHQAGLSSNGAQTNTNSVFKCFFAMAKPYPSRNTAMLNTFLELKVENERLQQRLRDAKATEAELDRLEAQQQAIPSHLLLQQPPYAGNPHVRGNTIPPSQSFAWTLNSAASTSSRNFDSRQFYPSLPDLSPMGGAGGSSLAVGSSSPSVGDQVDPSSDQTLPRKKSKKTFVQELYCCMTCGRTDSPEWRKGPQGPKTLCNACGLRWAKSVRRDPNLAEGEPNVNDG